MTILGIDPGLALLGYGAIDAQPGGKCRLLGCGVIETKAGTPYPDRLRTIFRGVEELTRLYDPQDVVFEELFFSKNITTGIQVGGARGVALVAAANHTAELFEYTPMQIKLAVTGSGAADKRQVQTMVKLLLSLDEYPRPDDAADAVAAALTHASNLRVRDMYRIK